MSNARVPNYKIDSLIANLETFSNYNGSIFGWVDTYTPHTSVAGLYAVKHWNTRILELNLDTMEIEYLYPTVYSQTTSRLVGRIIRNLPRASVEQFLNRLNQINPTDAKRLARMAGI
jgi:hypothetical protein